MTTYKKWLLALGIILLIYATWLGYAWQTTPIYLAIALIALIIALNKRGKRKIASLSSIALLTVLSSLLWYIFPTIKFPAPTGKYSVGVHYDELETQRPETFSYETDDYRTLYLKIWYPAAEVDNHPPAPYIEGGQQALTKMSKRVDLPVPPFLFDQLIKAKTHSYIDAPLASGKFPLLTFSHGFGSWFGQNTPLMEELASRGFIIVAIGHSHQTMFTAQDEHTMINYPQVIPWAPAAEDSIVDLKHDIMHASTDTLSFRNAFFDCLRSAPSINANLNIWATDVREVLDKIMVQNTTPNAFLYNRIDTAKIGALGMSFGGATAIEVAYQDARIKAAVDLDGFNYGSWWKDTLNVPVAFLEAPYNDQYYSRHGALKHQTTAGYYCFMFEGTEHYNFTDVNVFSPMFQRLGILGEADGEFMLQAMNNIIPDFFESIFANRPFQAEKHYLEGAIFAPKY